MLEAQKQSGKYTEQHSLIEENAHCKWLVSAEDQKKAISKILIVSEVYSSDINSRYAISSKWWRQWCDFIIYNIFF